MTLTRWRRFVDTPAAAFELLPTNRWAALSGPGKEAYNEARLNDHSEMVIVATSTLREVARPGRLLTLLNRREISARRGLIVSGQQTTGKTTALKQLGRTHELMVRQRHPARSADRIPVIYVTTPPKGSPRKLAMEFARFLGLPPVKRGYNTTDIADAVCQIMLEARVDLVVVDELHNLNLATAAGEDMSDHLKYFTEHLPATSVYAGIDVQHRLFTGGAGKQIADRCVVINTGPFPCDTEWKGLVATLEGALRLHRHEPGTLYRLAVANQLHADDLRAQLTGTRGHAPITVEDLAATGRSSHNLGHALPELRPDTAPGADPPLPAHVRRTICWRCAARRSAFIFAVTWQPAEVMLCRSHHIWLGSVVRAHRGGEQYDVSGLPEILRGQRHHNRLARRHGRQTTADAVAEAAHITALWARHGMHGDRRKPLIHAFLGRNALTGRLPSGDPLTPVVTYPDTIDLAGVLAMPRWRSPTGPATKREIREFRCEVNRLLAIRHQPVDSPYDPLFRWFQKHHAPCEPMIQADVGRRLSAGMPQ